MAEPLLVGWPHARPIRCELEHDGHVPDGVTVMALDVLACEEHVTPARDVS